MSDNQLWSDERIITAISECVSSDRDGTYLVYEEVEDVVKKLRDEYEARIAELQPRYPELDASVEAGEELERWKERCHALEAENEALQSWCKAVEDRLKADIDQQKEDMAEIERLRALLPDAETLRAGDRLGAVVTNTIMTPDDYADLTTIRAWLQRLETPP